MDKKPYDDTKPILTVPDLTRRINEGYEQKKKEALLLQEEQKERLGIAIQEEKDLIKKLKTAKGITAKMEQDYSSIEVKLEAEIKAQIEINSIREKDVLSGKVTLREFTQKGTSEKQITEKTIKESTGELERSLKAIRTKRIEILEIERSLYSCQNRIKNLILQPALILQKIHKDMLEVSDTEIGEFLADVYGSREALKQTEHLIFLTQGKSLSPGYRWDRLTPKEALKVQYDPILPFELVSKLKTELAKLKDAEFVSVVFWLKAKDIDVNPTFKKSELSRGEKIIKTSDLKERLHE